MPIVRHEHVVDGEPERAVDRGALVADVVLRRGLLADPRQATAQADQKPRRTQRQAPPLRSGPAGRWPSIAVDGLAQEHCNLEPIGQPPGPPTSADQRLRLNEGTIARAQRGSAPGIREVNAPALKVAMSRYGSSIRLLS